MDRKTFNRRMADNARLNSIAGLCFCAICYYYVNNPLLEKIGIGIGLGFFFFYFLAAAAYRTGS